MVRVREIRAFGSQSGLLFRLVILSIPCWLIVSGCGPDGSDTIEETRFTSVSDEVAETWMASVRPEQNDWSWGDGVLMFGLTEAAGGSKGPEYWDYMQQWIDSHIEKGFYVAFSDNCPTGIAAVRLYMRKRDAGYLEAAHKIVHYLKEVASRTSDGGLNHMGWITVDQLWVDSLFMFGVFLTEMGSMTGDNSYFDLLISQIKIFASHLRDPRSGLFLHMWDEGRHITVPTEPVFWARGNGWVFVTLVELLARLPRAYPDRAEMASLLATMAESLAEHQEASGLWHTVLNGPDTYLETSATALFCYGFAKGIRLGLLEPAYRGVVDLARQGLVERLYRDCSGSLIVSGTSHGTSPGTLEDYQNITVGDQVPYGVGALMLAASETGLVVPEHSLAHEEHCPSRPPLPPRNAVEFVEEGIRCLGKADLEGAQEYFAHAERMDGGLGSAHLGSALIEAVFLGLDLFDTITRYTISELTWEDVQIHIRSKSLPDLDSVRFLLKLAMNDPQLLMEIPELQINRRGLYTPLRELMFEHSDLASLDILLGIVGTILRILS